MSLTRGNENKIRDFFRNDEGLIELFREIYSLQEKTQKLFFAAGDGRIVGFKVVGGDRFIAYVARTDKQYEIRVATRTQQKEIIPFNTKSRNEIITALGLEKFLDDGYDNLLPIALKEEEENCCQIYKNLENNYLAEKGKLPFPDITLYDIGGEDIQYKKRQNQPIWMKMEEIEPYKEESSLYNGHLRYNVKNYYFLTSQQLKTYPLECNNLLVNVDDCAYKDIVNVWKFPNRYDGIDISRNIEIKDKKVVSVDILYDNENELASHISDIFLRKVLLKNRSNTQLKDIINTIQEKQNEIRSYDENASFLVQGCAGSGKTIVLLHRIRYLRYNKMIGNDNYKLLIPNAGLKDYISKSASEFNIAADKIISFTDYYKNIADKVEPRPEEDELNFPSNYLTRVYSEDFVRQCYMEVINELKCLADDFTDLCDDEIKRLFEKEKESILVSIELMKRQTIDFFNEEIGKVNEFEGLEPINNYDNLDLEITRIEEFRDRLEREYSGTKSNMEETIESEILKNAKAIEIKTEIEITRKRLEVASIFTKKARAEQLARLEQKYERLKEVIANEIKDKEKVNIEKAAQKIFAISRLINKLNNNLDTSIQKIATYESELQELQVNEPKKYSAEITALKNIIVSSGNFYDKRDEIIDNLVYTDLLPDFLNKIRDLYYTFQKYEDSQFNISEGIKSLFDKNSDALTVLNKKLFSKSIKILREKNKITPCRVYKHYWFLKAYFAYLLKGMNSKKQYIFIDEAQDLSLAEIRLIRKYNRDSSVINVFGDVNQNIAPQGLSNWSKLDFVERRFELKENFRNTNQIIDYCNSKFNFKMDAVGVSLDNVDEYEALNEYLPHCTEDIAFIVKDEASKKDLSNILANAGIKSGKLYTVAGAKGLEFKEVTVFDENMYDNEKYIAYTRALEKLNIVKVLPWDESKHKRTIKQEEED